MDRKEKLNCYVCWEGSLCKTNKIDLEKDVIPFSIPFLRNYSHKEVLINIGSPLAKKERFIENIYVLQSKKEESFELSHRKIQQSNLNCFNVYLNDMADLRNLIS